MLVFLQIFEIWSLNTEMRQVYIKNLGVLNKAYGCDFSTKAYRKIFIYKTYILTKNIYNRVQLIEIYIYEYKVAKMK